MKRPKHLPRALDNAWFEVKTGVMLTRMLWVHRAMIPIALWSAWPDVLQVTVKAVTFGLQGVGVWYFARRAVRLTMQPNNIEKTLYVLDQILLPPEDYPFNGTVSEHERLQAAVSCLELLAHQARLHHFAYKETP